MATVKAIVPECRYGHGHLLRVDNHGDTPEWGLFKPRSNSAFLLALYVCPECGYSEIFDLEPWKTSAAENKK